MHTNKIIVQKWVWVLGFWVLTVLGCVRPTLADVMIIVADKDNTIYSEFDLLSNGTGDHVFAGKTAGGNSRRALVAFDVAGAIPAGSKIDSVRFQLYMSRTQAGNQNVTLHRLLADWGEGTSNAGGGEGSGAIATDGDATWRYTFFDAADPPSSPEWASTGGDFVATSSADRSVGGIGFYAWGSTAQMVADVQGWLDTPATNYGWLVRGNEGPNVTAKRFDSRQNGNTSRRPMLTINFTPAVVCTKGDVNQDTRVDGGDIGPFVDTLVNGAMPGTAEFCAADVNDDQVLDVSADMAAFVNCLLAGTCP
ncbi:MAG: DNRLRE domain-containing protein [Phycisphaerales bacterium]|nr:DNRLRE domain-containing protein [Phycisphaerales bacterium]